jgi:LPPG:FO 2-phospho-L-lactate transferase
VTSPHYLALSGGVGGAKLALGLAKALPPESLTIVANTSDDFEHLGLHISPDLDTVMYTLAGLANPDTGWGLEGESWNFMSQLEALGSETWFQLGDKDLATHIERTRQLKAGQTLSEVTKSLSTRLGVAHPIVPMSDDPVQTIVKTPDQDLSFQHYFVRDKCQPTVTGFRFEGIREAKPAPDFLAAMTSPGLAAIIICPSNPFVSVDPILLIPEIRALLPRTDVPIVAVSPIVSGMALKGPAAKMMAELGMPQSATAVAAYYSGLIDALVIDTQDAEAKPNIEDLDMAVLVTNTIMNTQEDKKALALDILKFVDEARR